jgi:hypothetical protein
LAALATAALLGAGPAAAQSALDGDLAFDPVTKVDGETLQVVFGQRAVFHLGDGGRPAIDAVETGQLADAHLKGVAKETFAPPDAGKIAAALDGSAEKQVSILKLWNGLPHPIEYRLATLSLNAGKLDIQPVKPCVLAPGQVYTQSWPQPVVAVALTRFAEPDGAGDAPACPTATR